jgi:predicted transcriptional regulator
MSKRERQQGELEGEVMNVLWNASGSLTSQEILETINNGERDLALTTILTVLSRLVDKGMVKRTAGTGRSFNFTSTESREKHSAKLMIGLLSDTSNPALTFAQFTSGLTPKQLEALREALDK